MDDDAALYAQLKPDIEQIAMELFNFSEFLLKKNGDFLPHGAALTSEGEVKLIGAVPDTEVDLATSVEVLSVLHDGLRASVAEGSIKAVAVAENVSIVLEGQKSKDSIKVLVEHEEGLTTALYLPFTKTFLRGYKFEEMFSVVTEPEVNAWS